MNYFSRLICMAFLFSFAIQGFGQKVKVGYDKATDFSKYHTYTWAEPQTIPERPVLYDYVVKAVDAELHAKGLERTEKNGDLTLVPAGGIDYGSNLQAGTPVLPVYGGGPPPGMNATMWTGAQPFPSSSGPITAKGKLTLEFVDRQRNDVVWNGTVTQALDPNQKEESLSLAEKAVVKLLKKFPPKGH
jgi:uncharacterized protein DUF4136